MVDGFTIQVLGANTLEKQTLEKYFVANKSRLQNKINKEHAFFPIILFPHDTNHINQYVKRIEDEREQNTNENIPNMLFLIRVIKNSNIIEVDQDTFNRINNLFDKVIEVKMEYKNINEQLINKVGETIVQILLHPPKEKYVVKEVAQERRRKKVGVVGLGFVGLPVAIAFSKKYDIVGFDIDEEKINQLNKFHDPMKQVSQIQLEKSAIEFVTDAKRLQDCHYIFVTVPTPIGTNHKPDLSFLTSASTLIGKNLSPNSIVVYESTVYPGTTEQICIPILERESQLTAGTDFYVGYSPERINPGDDEHTFTNIPKVISGQDEYTLNIIYDLYQSVLESEIFKAPSIKVAEAAKIVENTQRDVNIALMNELAIIFNRLNINTMDVIEAAKTKWNFTPYYPGLVGGHCIGVDPNYLIYKSNIEGYYPEFLAKARKINDSMPSYVVHSLFQYLISEQINLKKLRVTILGATFKENISDIRNSKAIEIVNQLQDIGINVQVYDPYVSNEQLASSKVKLFSWEQLIPADVIIIAVAHNQFKLLTTQEWQSLCKLDKGLIMDLKNIIPQNKFKNQLDIWRL